MPGTPATSPRVGAPRYSNADPATFATQVNAVTDAFDAAVRRLADPIVEADMGTGAAGLAKGSFSAYRNAALSLTSPNVVVFDTDSGTDAWDISGWYDTTTGRFTPQIAGIYRFSWLVSADAAAVADVYFIASLLKNGTQQLNAPPNWQRAAATPLASGGSLSAKANGTTDFFQVRLQHNNGATKALLPSVANTFFQGEFVGRT